MVTSFVHSAREVNANTASSPTNSWAYTSSCILLCTPHLLCSHSLGQFFFMELFLPQHPSLPGLIPTADYLFECPITSPQISTNWICLYPGPLLRSLVALSTQFILFSSKLQDLTLSYPSLLSQLDASPSQFIPPPGSLLLSDPFPPLLKQSPLPLPFPTAHQ